MPPPPSPRSPAPRPAPRCAHPHLVPGPPPSPPLPAAANSITGKAALNAWLRRKMVSSPAVAPLWGRARSPLDGGGCARRRTPCDDLYICYSRPRLTAWADDTHISTKICSDGMSAAASHDAFNRVPSPHHPFARILPRLPLRAQQYSHEVMRNHKQPSRVALELTCTGACDGGCAITQHDSGRTVGSAPASVRAVPRPSPRDELQNIC
jgi:hypothetical protein